MQITVTRTIGVAGYEKPVKKGSTIEVYDVQEAKALIAQKYAVAVDTPAGRAVEPATEKAVETQIERPAPPVISSKNAPKGKG